MKNNWPEACTEIAGWVSVAFMVFSIAQCTAKQSAEHTKIMTSPGSHIE
jgi:hypothetical protein